MASKEQNLVPTTQRAYTLRLRPAYSSSASKEEREIAVTEMQSALWATHEAVNKGAKVFGDWLLTMRGGLDHNLAETQIKEKYGYRAPTPQEVKNRRILLALSWLSVEDERGARDNQQWIIAYGDGCEAQQDNQDARDGKVLNALREILRARGVSESEISDPEVPGTWLDDCKQSLSSAIRPDAVWVNRSAKFDLITGSWNAAGRKRGDAFTLLSFLFKDEFLTIPSLQRLHPNEEGVNQEDNFNGKEVIAASSKGAGQRTRHPFSHLFGEGKPFGKPTRTLHHRENWHAYLKPLLDGTGLTLVSVANEENKRKGKQAENRSHTELQREMFSKAAARLAQITTKLRQQEQERQSDNDAKKSLSQMEENPEYADALAALQSYCNDYRRESGSAGEFYILPRQIAGWEQVITKWSNINIQDQDILV